MTKKPAKNTQAQSVPDEQPVQSVVDELTADLQRLQAEFINYKARTDSEKIQLHQFAKAEVIKDLLPVIDDLQRALSHLPKDLADNKWAQGVKSIHGRLLKQLEKMGVTPINALNQPFNPELHEAVQMEGEGDTHIVSAVLQPGYMLGDSVIRHAVVSVTST